MNKKQRTGDILKEKMDTLAYTAYKVTGKFPKEEIYGITSQLRRASLSIILNYIEGFARGRDKEFRNFLNISYGSLKETQYLLFFCYRENYLSKTEYEGIDSLADEVGAMLWKKIQTVKSKITK